MEIILAVAENGAVGLRGGLPWHLPEDLRRFRQLTLGHTVIMGRRTYESIGRPLSGRRNVVVTSGLAPAGCLAAYSLSQALASASGRAFVIGGVRLWEEAWPLADRLHLTVVHGSPEADTFFQPDLRPWMASWSGEGRGGCRFIEYVKAADESGGVEGACVTCPFKGLSDTAKRQAVEGEGCDMLCHESQSLDGDRPDRLCVGFHGPQSLEDELRAIAREVNEQEGTD